MKVQTRRRLEILVGSAEAFFMPLGVLKVAEVVMADFPALKGPVEAVLPLVVGLAAASLIYRMILRAAAIKDGDDKKP
jgi:hypothetical protein